MASPIATLPPPMMPAGTDPAQWAEYMKRWDAYAQAIGAAAQAASGFDREKLEVQYADAQKGRDNARELARLQADTSRYGYDLTRQTAIDQLKQSAYQFEQTHALDMQKLGLDRAKTATDYYSTPDRFIQAGDYINLSSRVLAGQPGAAPYGTVGTAQAKGSSDFAVLAAGGNPGRQIDAAQVASAGGSGADARQKALKALNDLPASVGEGLDSNDYAVLQASAAIRGMNLTPQQQAAFNASPQSKAILGSSLRRLGDNPDEWWNSQRRSLPGQGASRLA